MRIAPPFLALAIALVAGLAPAAAQAPAAAAPDGSPVELARTHRFPFHSNLLNRDFEIYVAEPARTLPGVKPPVIYHLDGDQTFPVVSELARWLALGGEVEPAYVVGVGYGDGANLRNHDYVHAVMPQWPATGGGGAFETFLITELKPAIEARYPTDPARAVLAGHSFGGLFVANVLVRHPDAFAGWLISSGSLWMQNEAVVRAAARLSRQDSVGKGRRVFVSVGALEDQGRVGTAADFAKAVGDPRTGFAVANQVWPGEDHLSVTTSAYSRGLRFLLPGTVSGQAQKASGGPNDN